MKSKKIIGLIVLILLIGCQTTPNNPGQMVTRAIETRYIDSNFEIAYTSAAHAFFALGFTIHHSEKDSGIIEGDNVNPNIDAKRGQMGPNDKRTKMRIQMVINGKAQVDPKVVDAIWIVTQREAMMTSGIDVPDDIKKKYNDLNSPQKNSSSDKNNLSD